MATPGTAPNPEPGSLRAPASGLGSLPYLVYKAMWENALEAGGHRDIHHLVNAMQWRTWGANAASFLHLAWTQAMNARARALFSHTHFRDFTEADDYIRYGAPAYAGEPPIPPPRPAVREIVRDDCVDCFRFLVDKDIISVNGFGHDGESYVSLALTFVGDSQVAKYCLLHMPASELFNPILIPWNPPATPTQEDYFPYNGHEFGGPCRVWIDRVHEVFSGDSPEATWPGLGLSTPGSNLPLFGLWSLPSMIPWIDATRAQKLYDMGVNLNRGYVTQGHTTWGALHCPGKHQGRHELMKWMASHLDGLVQPNRLAWSGPGSALVPEGHWPPWALALASGDRPGAGIIAKIPGINHLEYGIILKAPQLIPALPRTELIGWATMHFNSKGLGMLRQWLRMAWTELTRQKRYTEIISVLERILYRISVECVAIRELKRQPVPEGSTRAERTRQFKEIQTQKLDVSRRMVRMIVDDSIKEPRTDGVFWPGVPDDYPYRTLGDIPEYKMWARGVQGKRKGEFPLIKSVLDQLDCPTGLNRRELRSGHDPMDTSA